VVSLLLAAKKAAIIDGFYSVSIARLFASTHTLTDLTPQQKSHQWCDKLPDIDYHPTIVMMRF
jgi:hypothetical protein